MESIIAFAKTDAGAILGGCLIFVGISTYILMRAVVLPKIKASADEMAGKKAQLITIAGRFDFYLFSLLGATLLYYHFA